jgi:hypothetical protein
LPAADRWTSGPVFDRCYDAGPYPRRIDYSAQPDPPVKQAQWKWMKGLLAQKG